MNQLTLPSDMEKWWPALSDMSAYAVPVPVDVCRHFLLLLNDKLNPATPEEAADMVKVFIASQPKLNVPHPAGFIRKLRSVLVQFPAVVGQKAVDSLPENESWPDAAKLKTECEKQSKQFYGAKHRAEQLIREGEDQAQRTVAQAQIDADKKAYRDWKDANPGKGWREYHNLPPAKRDSQ